MSLRPESAHECERLLDAACYVLHALDEAAARSFAGHLATCEPCRREVSELQVVADALATGVPGAASPPELRARLMATVHAEAEPQAATAPQGETAVVAAPDAAPDTARRRPARRWPVRRLLPGLAATVALGVGLLVGALAIGGATGTRVKVIPASVVAPGYRASAVLRKAGTHLELVVVGMPAPPPGQIYEVWLERGTRPPEPTDALFSVTRAGDGSVGVPGYEAGVTQVLVTAEPLGGTLKPTRTPVIVAEV